MILIDDFDTDDFELQGSIESDEMKENLKREFDQDIFMFDISFIKKKTGKKKSSHSDVIIID